MQYSGCLQRSTLVAELDDGDPHRATERAELAFRGLYALFARVGRQAIQGGPLAYRRGVFALGRVIPNRFIHEWQSCARFALSRVAMRHRPGSSCPYVTAATTHNRYDRGMRLAGPRIVSPRPLSRTS